MGFIIEKFNKLMPTFQSYIKRPEPVNEKIEIALPVEVFENIFRQCARHAKSLQEIYKIKKSLSSVCRLFKEICSHYSIWSEPVKNLFKKERISILSGPQLHKAISCQTRCEKAQEFIDAWKWNKENSIRARFKGSDDGSLFLEHYCQLAKIDPSLKTLEQLKKEGSVAEKEGMLFNLFWRQQFQTDGLTHAEVCDKVIDYFQRFIDRHEQAFKLSCDYPKKI